MQAIRTLLIGSVGLLVIAGVVIAQAAPTLGNASITVDQQIHLGTNSHIFENGSVFLWTDGSNTGLGTRALSSNTTGYSNTASGYRALSANTMGAGNTASGFVALSRNTEGNYNTASGWYALFGNTKGSYNTTSGYVALFSNTEGNNNTASGNSALFSNTTGHRNTALGVSAGSVATTGNDNIFLGSGAEGVAGEGNTIRIGGTAVGTGMYQQNRTFINGIRGVTTGVADAVNVKIDSNGQLGTVSSSRRYKEDIESMGAVSERLLALRPVTFRYKKEFADGEKPIQYGLVAEEVAEVFPELVVYNEEGLPETVKYHLLSTLLLNELQEQASAMEAQAKNLAELEDVKARLVRLESMQTQPQRVAAVVDWARSSPGPGER